MDRAAIDEKERELAELSTHLEVATHRQLALLRELEPTGFWAEQRASSFAGWLSWRIGLSPGAAREKIRIARALGMLPAIDGAFALGRISFSKVRALTRVATPENEAMLVDWAQRTTAAHLEQICRGIRRADRDSDRATDAELRWVRQRAGDHGTVRIEAQLHPDEAAIVWAAIERARAEHALPQADALVRVASGEARVRSEVVVHVREEHLAEGTGALAATLDDGRRVSAEALRRVACDCATQAVTADASGTPIDVGRRRRVVTPALRRALLARDRCCRFPGCANRGWLDAHHVEHWLHGGETAMGNLVMLCPFHHRLLHEGGYAIVERAGAWAFLDPSGRDVAALPPPVPITRLDAQHAPSSLSASAGTRFDPDALLPDWDGRPPDVEACVLAAETCRRIDRIARDPEPN